METLRQLVAPDRAGARLDQFLAQALGWSRARLQKLLKAGLVTVDGAARSAAYRVRAAETVTVQVPPPEPSHLIPEPLALDIVYEDRDLLVLNKPPGLVVHPGAGHRGGTLLNALLYHCPGLQEIGEVSRPGLVHRLDKDTSGLLVAAKTALAHQSLVGQFAARETKKTYLALVWGRLPEPEGRIDKDIGRHPSQRHKMTAHPRRGKSAATRWLVLQEFPGPLTLVELCAGDRPHPSIAGASGLGGPPGAGRRHLRRRGEPPDRPPQTDRPQTPGAPPTAARLAPGRDPPALRRTPAWEAPLPEDFQAVVDKLASLH